MSRRDRLDNMAVMPITRREFNRLSAMAGAAFLGQIQEEVKIQKEEAAAGKTPVSIVKTADRESGIRKAVELLGDTGFEEKEVLLKCSYNSPDPFPATTHPDTLKAVVWLLKEKGAREIVLLERSGMGSTREVMEKLGTLDVIRDLPVQFLPLEELESREWKKIDIPGSHWKRGVEIPIFLNQNSCVVQVCNLKTHRFGGQFSASLKNSIGLIAKYSAQDGYNYMKELHASPDQRRMIAEVNQTYAPDLVIMDAVQSFTSGGPDSGDVAESGVIAAAQDRIAIDAAGLAILLRFGAGAPLNTGSIFDNEQIQRAAELGLGVRSSKEIRFIADGEASRALAAILENLLSETADD